MSTISYLIVHIPELKIKNYLKLKQLINAISIEIKNFVIRQLIRYILNKNKYSCIN